VEKLVAERGIDVDHTRALEHGPRPSEVTTDQAPAYPRVIELDRRHRRTAVFTEFAGAI
jgi:hypothetical protein